MILKNFLSHLLFFATVFGQQKISVEEIYKGTFRAQSMDEISMNSNQYTVLNSDRKARTIQIDSYDYATLKKKQQP
jgi:dipeptidyl-peptidase-4